MGTHVTKYKTENGQTRRVAADTEKNGAPDKNGADSKNKTPENPAQEGAKK